jgi:hypothetical protein
MNKLANIKMVENYVLDPSFEELIHTLALRHPLYTFGIKGIKPDDLEWISGKAPKFKMRPEDTPTETRFVSYVKVHSGTEELGTIAMDSAYVDGKRIQKYKLDCWRLGKRENSRTSSIRTTKLNVALRTFKKFFIPRAMLELYGNAKVELDNSFRSCLRLLQRPIDHGQLSPNSVSIERYAYLTLNNLAMDPDLHKLMTQSFCSEKYAVAMSKYMLAKTMENMDAHVVIAYNEGYLYWYKTSNPLCTKDEVGELQHLAYEDMPEPLKNNLAVLQLCKDNELVRDVGYRCRSDSFLVIPA